MKSELLENDRLLDYKYPYLATPKDKILAGGRRIVLFTEKAPSSAPYSTKGTVVWSSDDCSNYKVGFTGTWNESEFEPFDGVVKLSNGKGN